MENVLVINASGGETRVALVENGHIAEYYLDRKRDRGIVGNIYKGKVVRVLPGMQAAFVDIGLDKAAFLYVADVFYDPDFSDQEFDLTEGEHAEHDELLAPEQIEEREAQAQAERAAEVSNEVTPTTAIAAGGEPTEVSAAPTSEPAPAENGPAAAAGHGVPNQTQPGEPGGALSLVATTDPQASPVAPPVGAPPVIEPVAEPDAPVEAEPPSALQPVRLSAVDSQAVADAPAALTPTPNGSAEGALAGAGANGDDEEDDEEEDGDSPDQTDPTPFATAGGEAARGEGANGGPGLPEGSDRGSLQVPRAAGAGLQAGQPGSGRRRRRRRRKGAGGQSAPGAAQANGGAAAGGPAEKRQPLPVQAGAGSNGLANGQARGGPGANGAKESRREGGHAHAQIQDLLKEGQEILVQVVKDPIGTKGARVTSHISLPGRHLVFMPTVDHVGISRRIENEKERKRLRDIINRMRPPGTGFIVRTVADGVSEEKLAADIRFLIQEWNEVGKTKDKKGAPVLLHPDLDMVLRATRDLFTHDVGKLVIDDRDEYDRVLQFVENLEGDLKNHIELYVGEEPIFDAYGIEQEIKRALNRKVWLKSGGYLIIDQAEALVAVDVNSGRYTGKKNLEETITRINVEAAKEIVYQLRLRNIGGIIIIDFIDMDKAQNREKVFKTMQEALGRDRAKTNVLKISELGLIEMTRKRVRESIGRTLNEPCSYCDGEGSVKSKVTMAYEIFREIRREAQSFHEKTLVVNCHPEVAEILTNEERTELRYLMDRYNKTIQVKPQSNYHQEQYDIHGRSGKDKDSGREPREPKESARESKEAREAAKEAASKAAAVSKDKAAASGAAS